MGGACSIYGEKRNVYRTLVVKLSEKELLERPRSRWVDNINVDIKETGWEDMVWIFAAQDRGQWWVVVKKAINLHVA
jgi:hypothetical protein